MGLRNSESPSPAGKSVDAFQSLSRLATKARYITRNGRFCLCECAYILSSVSRPFLFLRNAETIGNKKRSWSTIGKGFISIISILWNHYIFADSSFVIIFCITPKLCNCFRNYFVLFFALIVTLGRDNRFFSNYFPENGFF